MIEWFWLIPVAIAGTALGAGIYHRRIRYRAYIEGRMAGEAEYERLLEGARKYHRASEEGCREITRIWREATAAYDKAIVDIDAAKQMLRVVR